MIAIYSTVVPLISFLFQDGKIVYPRTSEVSFKNRYFIDDQYSLTTTDNEDDSNSSLNPTTPLNQPSPSVQQYDDCLTNTNKTFSELLLNNTPTSQTVLPAEPAVATQHKQQSFLLNYELPQVKQQIDGGGKIKQNSKTKQAKSKNSTQNSNSNSSNATSGSASKKVSQLIFHEYRGPNKKSSVSRTSVNSDSSIKENELSSYKIRLEQQKMFLLFDEQNSPQQQHDLQVSNKMLQTQQTVSQMLPKLQPAQQQQQQTVAQAAQTTNQPPIQYVPLQIHPDTLKTFFNSQILSITAIGANNVPQQQQQHKVLQQALHVQPVLQPQQQQQSVHLLSNPMVTEPLKPQTNIEDMTMSELKEECRRRRLHVTGNKPKLIERIKMNSNNVKLPTPESSSQNGYHDTTQSLQLVKSPDSGVNMDGSPGVAQSKFWNIAADSLNRPTKFKYFV